MPSCKQIIDLASTSLDTSMSRRQRWQLRLHLLICRHCRRYLTQLRFLQQASAAMTTNLKTAVLSDEARVRIAKKLSQLSDSQE